MKTYNAVLLVEKSLLEKIDALCADKYETVSRREIEESGLAIDEYSLRIDGQDIEYKALFHDYAEVKTDFPGDCEIEFYVNLDEIEKDVFKVRVGVALWIAQEVVCDDAGRVGIRAGGRHSIQFGDDQFVLEVKPK